MSKRPERVEVGDLFCYQTTPDDSAVYLMKLTEEQAALATRPVFRRTIPALAADGMVVECEAWNAAAKELLGGHGR